MLNAGPFWWLVDSRTPEQKAEDERRFRLFAAGILVGIAGIVVCLVSIGFCLGRLTG